MTARAVCIRCGYYKAEALAKCPKCGFQPASEREQAQSLILSPAFDAGGTKIGRTPEELADIALQIEGGKAYAFSQVEMGVVAKAIAPRQGMRGLEKLVIGAIIVIAVGVIPLIILAWF